MSKQPSLRALEFLSGKEVFVAIVSDTSPLSYLVLIGEANLFCDLYGEICIPPAVENELRHPDGPAPLRRWSDTPPPWLEVSPIPNEPLEKVDSKTVERLQALDRGEREAILLAESSNARLLVIDDQQGRRIAKNLGLSITGTIGLLDVAAREDLIDVSETVRRLRETSFRASPELYRWLIERH